MAKKFDATLNALIDARPDDWANGFARLVGIPTGPSIVLDTDLATSVQADKIFRINGPSPTILHLELEANPRLGIPRELLRYNTLIDHQHDLPVESVLVLMRPKALASDQTGRYDRLSVTDRPIKTFHYHVVPVWVQSVEFWLNAGVGLSPLSLLTDEAGTDLASALRRFRDRLQDDTIPTTVADTLLGASSVLCGLRYTPEQIIQMYRSMNMVMESSTMYQWILQQGEHKGHAEGRSEGRTEGRNDEARAMVLRLGTKKFGPPTAECRAKLQAVSNLEQLEQLADRILDVKSWDELIAPE